MKSDLTANFTNGVRTVWLDLDDTLIDFHTNSRRALRLLYATETLGRFYPNPESWIEAYETHNHKLWDLYSRSLITQDYLRVDRFATPLSPMWEGSREELEAYSRRLDPLYLDLLASQTALVDGAVGLLRHLRDRGYTIGILSNGFSEVQHRKLRATGLSPLTDLVVLSDDIGINKPDPRLYLHAMERAGDPDPAHHIMIGDNPATDIAGARAAGWRAILLDPSSAHHTPAPTGPDTIVSARLSPLKTLF